MFNRQSLYPCMDERGCPGELVGMRADNYCPCWFSPTGNEVLLETNISSNEERIVQGCFFDVIPRLMIHVIRASNRPAAEMGQMRADVVDAAANAVTTLMVPVQRAMIEQIARPGPRGDNASTRDGD